MRPMSSSNERKSSPSNGRPVHGRGGAGADDRATRRRQRNVAKALSRIGEAAAAGANIVCLQELFAGQYPCQSEDHTPLRRGRADSRPHERGAGRSRRGSTAWWWSVRCSSAARRACITTRPWSSTPTARPAGMYRKMHIPDDPLYYEKFYFTPGDLGFRGLRHALRPDRRVRLLGPVVSRGGPADGPGRRADPVLSHRHRLAARRESRSTAPASIRPGKP